MKFGFRTPSPSKTVKAMTTGAVKRNVKSTLNPLYGKKGMGVVNDPKRAAYNAVYNRTTFGAGDVVKAGKGSSKSNVDNQGVAYEDDYIPEITPEQIKKAKLEHRATLIGVLIMFTPLIIFSSSMIGCVANDFDFDFFGAGFKITLWSIIPAIIVGSIIIRVGHKRAFKLYGKSQDLDIETFSSEDESVNADNINVDTEE